MTDEEAETDRMTHVELPSEKAGASFAERRDTRQEIAPTKMTLNTLTLLVVDVEVVEDAVVLTEEEIEEEAEEETDLEETDLEEEE